MIIHGPKNVPYDKDLGPVFLTDWYHDEYFNIVKNVMSAPVSCNTLTVKSCAELLQPSPPPSSDNNLINGKMNYDCSLVTDGTACELMNPVSIPRSNRSHTFKARPTPESPNSNSPREKLTASD